MMACAKNNQEKDGSKIFVLINCFEGKIKKTIKEIERIDTVTEVKQTDGMYDAIVTMESTSINELKNALVNKIRKIETIRCTLTLQSSLYGVLD